MSALISYNESLVCWLMMFSSTFPKQVVSCYKNVFVLWSTSRIQDLISLVWRNKSAQTSFYPRTNMTDYEFISISFAVRDCNSHISGWIERSDTDSFHIRISKITRMQRDHFKYGNDSGTQLQLFFALTRTNAHAHTCSFSLSFLLCVLLPSRRGRSSP